MFYNPNFNKSSTICGSCFKNFSYNLIQFVLKFLFYWINKFSFYTNTFLITLYIANINFKNDEKEKTHTTFLGKWYLRKNDNESKKKKTRERAQSALHDNEWRIKQFPIYLFLLKFWKKKILIQCQFSVVLITVARSISWRQVRASLVNKYFSYFCHSPLSVTKLSVWRISIEIISNCRLIFLQKQE